MKPLSTLALLLLTSLASAEDIRVSHRTPYLVQGIGRVHRIDVTGKVSDEGGDGEVRLDPNTCGVNAYGDPTFCTLIAVDARPVTFVPVEAEAGKPMGRLLFEVRGTMLDSTLTLVVPESGDGAPRLVVRDGDKVTHVVNLEPLPRPGLNEEK